MGVHSVLTQGGDGLLELTSAVAATLSETAQPMLVATAVVMVLFLSAVFIDRRVGIVSKASVIVVVSSGCFLNWSRSFRCIASLPTGFGEDVLVHSQGGCSQR